MFSTPLAINLQAFWPPSLLYCFFFPISSYITQLTCGLSQWSLFSQTLSCNLCFTWLVKTLHWLNIILLLYCIRAVKSIWRKTDKSRAMSYFKFMTTNLKRTVVYCILQPHTGTAQCCDFSHSHMGPLQAYLLPTHISWSFSVFSLSVALVTFDCSF